jgi:hypothetical protein
LIEEQKGDPVKGKKKEGEEKDAAIEKELFEQNFLFAVIWACGGAVVADSRADFSEFIKRIPGVKFPLEKALTIFDFYPLPSTAVQTPWMKAVPKYNPPEDAYLVTKVFISSQISFF